MTLRFTREEMREFQKLGPDYPVPDKWTKYCHLDCTAGKDIKFRLGLKLSDDGSMLFAHCFNCGGKGALKVGSALVDPVIKPLLKELSYSPADFAKYMDKKMGHASTKTLESLMFWSGRSPKCLDWTKDCWHELIVQDFFGTVATTDAVWVPRPNGWERRDVNDATPKWDRFLDPSNEDQSIPLRYATTASKTAVICEDPFSAMKIALAGYVGIALCGSYLPSEDFCFKLSLMYDRVVIWLDNDNETVREISEKTQDRLRLYFKAGSTYGIHLRTDPKNYTLEKIREYASGSVEDVPSV